MADKVSEIEDVLDIIEDYPRLRCTLRTLHAGGQHSDVLSSLEAVTMAFKDVGSNSAASKMREAYDEYQAFLNR